VDLEQDLRSKIKERWETFNSSLTVLRSSILVSLILVSLLLSACASIRPVAKIGLVAPFEGLYRRSGYEALDAMRMAIDESQSDAIDLLPVALDGTADAERTRRAVEKLLTDDSVQAIIGPLSPARVADVGDLLIDQPITWIVPYAIDPDGGFADPITSNEWATRLVSAVAAEAKRSGAARLTLAGNKAGWPNLSDEEWSTIAGLDVAHFGDLDDLSTDDALFWMGSAADGASFLNELRSRFPELPFWLGPQGEDPVFAERAQSMHQVHWATWVDVAYNGRFSDQSLASPGKYQIYQATVVAARGIIDGQRMAKNEWFVQMFAFGDDGTSTPLAPR
jgi:hypothetical protein